MPNSRPRNTLAGDIANELTEMVLSGAIRPGDFLPPQKDLAEQLGVGVSTIREAVQALSAMGMVETRAGKGTWIPEDALNTLIKPAVVRARLGELKAGMVCETRRVIEVAQTEFAALRATPEDIQRMRGALESMERSMHDIRAFVEADLEFHMAVAEASRNDLLKQFYQLAHKLLAGVISELVHPTKVREEALALQRAIAEAIERHDPEAARQAAFAHMQQVGTLLEAYDGAL